MTSDYILCFDEHEGLYLAHADQKVWKQHKYLKKVPNALGPGKDLYLYTQKEIDAWNNRGKRTLSNRIRDRLGFDERDRLADLQNGKSNKYISKNEYEKDLLQAQRAYSQTALGRFGNAKETIQNFKDTKLSEVRSAIDNMKTSREEKRSEKERAKQEKERKKQIDDIAQSLEQEAERKTNLFNHVSITDVYKKRRQEKEKLLRDSKSEDAQAQLRLDIELLEFAYNQSIAQYKTPEVQDMVRYIANDTISHNRISVDKSYNQLKKSLTTQMLNARNKEQIDRYDNQLKTLEMAYKAMVEIYNTDENAIIQNPLEVYNRFYSIK